MAEEFGTVNVRRSDRAREIEVIRQQYRHHRETLLKLAGDAPTEHLAAEYNRLTQVIDTALVKLNDLEGMKTTGPGMKPLVTPPAAPEVIPEESHGASPARLALIIGAGVLVLALIAALMWRASSDERPETPIVTESTPVETMSVTPAPEPPPPAVLSVAPPKIDYGTIRKGTRAARQFEITNSTDQPITIAIPRSKCRCLYYDYANVVPPKGKETITVTIDGARAAAGALQETLTVRAKKDPNITASFELTATIR